MHSLSFGIVLAWICLAQLGATDDSAEPDSSSGGKQRLQSKDGSGHITQEVSYIWPTPVWTIPFSVDEFNSLIHPSVGARLADIGLKAYNNYVKKILPLELQADPKFADEYRMADGSRTNLAFARWQKRVFAQSTRIPLEELSFDGSPIPRLPNIPYGWKELYQSQEYKQLRGEITRLSKMYVEYCDKKFLARGRIRTFIWAEVYNLGDSLRPQAHTGTLLSGVYYARYTTSKKGAQKHSVEDARGVNPPYGKTHAFDPQQGQMQIFPAWSSRFLTPHLSNSSNVFFKFVAWPEGGARDMDWEDDPAGDFVFKRNVQIKKPRDAKVPPSGIPKSRSEL